MNRHATSRAMALRILCAVALLFIGFAHRPLAAGMPSAFEQAAYVLPDGSFADLCINGGAVDGKIKHGPQQACEACRIANALLLPPPTDLHGTTLSFRHVAAVVFAERIASLKRERPGAPPRAPPALAA